MPFKTPSSAPAFFRERSPNHCQGLCRTFSEFDAHSLSYQSWNHIRPDTQLQIKGRKTPLTSTQLSEILYTDSQYVLVPSPTIAACYYNCCTGGSTSPGNYGYRLVYLFAINLYVLKAIFFMLGFCWH
jgi:hypothetical protein